VSPQLFQGTHFPPAIVDVKGEWVTFGGQEQLWLPPDYRPGSIAIYHRDIAIGCPSGRVLFLQLNCKKEENGEGEV
jgi:hypothetical protein